MVRQRLSGIVLVLLLMAPMVSSLPVDAQNDEPVWRSVGLDPTEWTDRPASEDSPMMDSYTGNAIIKMNVSYQSSWASSRVEGDVVIELFEQWAPVTTTNMIAHVESGMYDGVFFHPGAEFNQGNINTFNDEEVLAKMSEAEGKCKEENSEGLILQEIFSYSKTLDSILSHMSS